MEEKQCHKNHFEAKFAGVGGLECQMLQPVKEDEVLERACGLGRRRSFLTSLRVLFVCGEVSSRVGRKI